MLGVEYVRWLYTSITRDSEKLIDLRIVDIFKFFSLELKVQKMVR